MAIIQGSDNSHLEQGDSHGGCGKWLDSVSI